MVPKVVAKLKTGSVKSVVPFGKLDMPSPPYDVVKTEIVPGVGRRFRVIAHRAPTEREQLEDHIREVVRLLEKFQAKSRHGAVNRLGRVESIVDVSVTSDDGTISMEAAFIMPTRTF